MYLDHFGLKEKPFEPTADPKYIWLSEENIRALKVLREAFLKDEGYIVLSGDAGAGKNALMNSFVKLVEKKSHSAMIWDPNVEPLEFFNLLSLEFRINRIFDTKKEFFHHFKSLVENASLNHLKLLIVIDESQSLKPELVPELNQLLDVRINRKKYVNILFLIQTKEPDNLFGENSTSFNERIIGRHHVEPLSQEDTCRLVEHRLKVSGAARQIFTREALHEIFMFSGGCPRLINLICDHALLTGYAAGPTVIDHSIVATCASELQISNSAL
jgi:general secretion pathway protein A